MTRTFVRRRPFGFRTTPDDLRKCIAFLLGAAILVRKGLPNDVPGSWATRRIAGRSSAAFRRRS